MKPLDFAAPPEAYVRSPFLTIGQFRAECPHHIAARNAWAVGSRRDVLALLRDDRLSLTQASSFEDRSDQFRQTMVRALRAYFARAGTDALTELVERACREQIAKIRASTRADLVADFARIVPLAVMGELLAVPPEHRAMLGRLATEVLCSYDLDWPGRPAIEASAKQRLDGYFVFHLARLHRGELTSPLTKLLLDVQRNHDVPAASMPDVFTKLLLAGTTTTAGCLASILASLMEDHGVRTALIDAHPDDLADFTEELIRLHSPVLAVKREARTDMSIGGADIAAGERVYLFTAAANRDPAAYDAPDTPCPHARPAAHLTFGHGRYACLGAPLARLEIRTALSHIRPLLHRLHAVTPVRWRAAWLLHEPVSIEVAVSGGDDGVR